MAYKKLRVNNLTESDFREIWEKEYCKERIITFDGVIVSFYTDMFDHAFFESDNWKRKDKSIFSLNRAEKMMWIKDALQDSNALLKKGFKKNKPYSDERRVTIVKGNYIVIIRFYKKKQAKFVTAYENTDKENMRKIKASPDWNGYAKWIED